MERMQCLTELTLIEMCNRISVIERVMETTKGFSLKFNGHLKLITALVNTLDEEEENLMLYEEELEKKADHGHQRLIFSHTKEGQDFVKLEERPSGNTKSHPGHSGKTIGKSHTHNSASKSFNPKTTIKQLGGGVFNNTFKARKLRTINEQIIEQSNPQPKLQEMYKSNNEALKMESKSSVGKVGLLGHLTIGMDAKSEDGVERRRRDGNNLNKHTKRGAVGMNQIDLVHGFEEQKEQDESSLKGSMTQKFDVFMKENEFLKEMVKNGEQSTKHLKECLFKLIDAFQEKGHKKDQFQKIEKIERINIHKEKTRGEENTLDIKVNHNYLGQELNQNFSKDLENLKRENNDYKQKVRELQRQVETTSNQKINFKMELEDLRRAKEDGNQWDSQERRQRLIAEEDSEKLKIQLRKERRKKNELDEEIEELRSKLRDCKRKYRDEFGRRDNARGAYESGSNPYNNHKEVELKKRLTNKEEDLFKLKLENEQLRAERQKLQQSFNELKRESIAFQEVITEDSKIKLDNDRQEKLITELAKELATAKHSLTDLEKEIEEMNHEREKFEKKLRRFVKDKANNKGYDTQMESKLNKLEVSKLKNQQKRKMKSWEFEKKKLLQKVKFYKERYTFAESKQRNLQEQNKQLQSKLKEHLEYRSNSYVTTTGHEIHYSDQRRKKPSFYSYKGKWGHNIKQYTVDKLRIEKKVPKKQSERNVFLDSGSHGEVDNFKRKVHRGYKSHTPMDIERYNIAEKVKYGSNTAKKEYLQEYLVNTEFDQTKNDLKGNQQSESEQEEIDSPEQFNKEGIFSKEDPEAADEEYYDETSEEEEGLDVVSEDGEESPQEIVLGKETRSITEEEDIQVNVYAEDNLNKNKE